ncbi:MAG: hypothetical protein KDH90_23265, partial [Anaerolineae bacterium]|nr:hypothetical protein [Anaerolineae bacterium]
ADGAVGHDWSVSVRPLAGDTPIDSPGGGIVQVDAANPVHGTYPTSRWSTGEIVADDYWLALPPGVVADGVEVVVYRQGSDGAFDNLAVVRLARRDS